MATTTVPLEFAEHTADGRGPVVLLHGFPLTGAMWDELVPALADRYRVIVPDLRGHGRTAAPPGPYAVADHAADVVALLDRLGIERAAVVGLSMGGFIAMHLLADHADRVSAAVLADTRAPGDPPDRQAIRRAQAAVIRSEGLGAFAEQVLPRMFSPVAFSSRPDLVDRFRRTITGQRPEAVVAALLGLAMRPPMLGRLVGVTVPSLVLVGENDVATTPDDSRELAATIPSAELEVIPRVGHMSCWENPAAFNAAVRGFLDRVVTA